MEPYRRPLWKTVLLVLLVLGLLASLCMNALLSLAVVGKSAASASGTSHFKQTLVDGDKDQQDFIAVVPIQGMIAEAPSDNPGKGSVGQLTLLLKDLEDEKHLKGVLLDIDSPGGGVTASDRMYEALRRFKEKTKVPMVAVFDDVAASGGYYVAMAADHIVAHPTSITGSIGVIAQMYNVSELIGKVGVKVNTVKSLNWQGRESFKDIGSPFRPMRPEERLFMQNLITEMWTRFTQVVSTGRKGKLTLADVQKLADGKVYTGQSALRLKLVDQVGYTEDAYAEIRKRCGNKDARIVRFAAQRGWEELFSAQLSAAPATLTQQIPPTRIMYLWDPR